MQFFERGSAMVTGDPSMVSAPYDTDGDPATFDPDEREMIHRWWSKVAEDFAPWDVNVTTQDPGSDALAKTSTGDPEYGIRVVLSPTNWRGSAGVACLGSFSLSTDTPVFVFNVASGERAADTSAHEVGHSLGFATVAAMIAEADAALGANGLTLAGHPRSATRKR